QLCAMRIRPRGPYTSVLLGEQSVSKADGRGSTPRARACRRGSTEKGACLVNRLMLVRIQSSALERVNPDGVADCIGPSEGPGPGSSPGRDTERQSVSRVCRMSTAVFETARRGSIPRRGTETKTSLGCAGFACDPAKVED